jgi:hypothetical protein
MMKVKIIFNMERNNRSILQVFNSMEFTLKELKWNISGLTQLFLVSEEAD